MGKTAIIILNYNNPADTINCIDSVERFNTAPVKYVIVDNGSTAPGVVSDIDNFLCGRFGENYRCLSEGDPVPESLPYVTFFVSKTNDGYARGNNKGISLVENDPEIERLLILNNDILFIEDIIPGLCEKMDSIHDCAIISPLLLKKDRTDIDVDCARLDTSLCDLILNNILTPISWFFPKFFEKFFNRKMLLYSKSAPYPKLLQIELPSGSCMLIDKEFFKSIGCFDPNTFLYYEENILYRKIKATNKVNYLYTDLKCIHIGSSTISVILGSKTISKLVDSSDYYVRTYLSPSLLTYWIFKLSCVGVKLCAVIKDRYHRYIK